MSAFLRPFLAAASLVATYSTTGYAAETSSATTAAAPSPALALADGVLTLPEAIQLALAKNYDVQISSLGEPIAGANLLAEWGAFDPVLSGSYFYSEDGNPQSADPFGGSRPPSSIIEADTYEVGVGGATPWGMTYQLGASTQNRRGTFNSFADNYYTFAGLEVTQPLLRGFGFSSNFYGVRIARANRHGSLWDYRQTVTDVITQVIYAYHDLKLAEANLATSERSRELAAGLLDENQKRFQAGSLSDADVTAARARVASREEAILIARQAVATRRNFLKQLISDDRSPALLDHRVEIAPPTALPDLTPTPAADFQRALELRPDYQQARLDVERADLTRRYRRNQVLPRVDLVGSYGYNGLETTFGDSWDTVRDRDSRSYSIGAVVSVPLTFAQQRGRYRAAKLTQQQTELTLARLEQDILVQVGNAAGEIETARQRVESTTRFLQLAQQNLDDELKKLRAGTGSTFFVLEQQERLSSAEIRQAAAAADYQKALAAYDRILGTTLAQHRVSIED